MSAQIKPMLANSIDLSDLPRYVTNDAWRMQDKANGQRYMIEVTEGKVEVWNRQGMPKTSMMSHAVLGEFESEDFKKGHWIFDGELVNKRLLLFDLPLAGNLVVPNDPFEHRFFALSTLVDEVWQPDSSRIVLLPCADTPDEKLAMAKAAQDNHGEGVMLRLRTGIYRAGRSSELLKCKFVHECDAIITAIGVGGHNNVVLSLLDPDNNKVVEIGRASANGKKPVPAVGHVWEVRFQNAGQLSDTGEPPAEPNLYQPRLVRKRTDKEFHECLIDQLDHCYTNKELDLKTRGDM